MRHKYIFLTCILVLLSGVVFADRTLSYDDYAAVLKSYVDDEGMVNYKKLKAGPEKLNAFMTSIGSIDPNKYDRWNDKEKISLWLNAYNAFTLKAIIDNYPIKSSFFRSRIYPKNSIRQIPGVWDKITFKVMREKYTLEYIEHEILRKKFNEPRIHMAMVCAAMGCPSLRNEPYTAKKLDRQLDSQSRKFLANPKKFRFDTGKKIVFISPIFKWFGKDFMKPSHRNKEAAIIEFVSNYLDKEYDFFSSPTKTVKIKYQDYDWSLNEQR